VTTVQELADRVRPGEPTVLALTDLGVVGLVALAAVLVPVLWRPVRLGVTLVHELGHALVGIAVGRRFTGFVLRGDASGHAVTRGRPRGAGLVATTWAGYPAPAVLAAGIAWSVGRGWAAPVLTVLLLVLLVTATRVRSVLTGVVVLAVLVGGAALWWWRDDDLQAQVMVAVAGVLLVGAWRHLLASSRDRSPGNDARVLGTLTPLPRAVWTFTFALVCAASTWVVWTSVR
jgi:hypothetical protein